MVDCDRDMEIDREDKAGSLDPESVIVPVSHGGKRRLGMDYSDEKHSHYVWFDKDANGRWQYAGRVHVTERLAIAKVLSRVDVEGELLGHGQVVYKSWFYKGRVENGRQDIHP